jgi:hypothetical protein
MITEEAASAPMPRPSPSKPPLKVNVFRFMLGGNVQLLPLFPYMGPGDIVPTGAATRGGSNQGYFLHINTVDEVVVAFGARSSRGRAGQVHVGPRKHGVAGLDPQNPDEFRLAVVTQRQVESGPQREAVIFPCEQCATEVLRVDFGPEDVQDAKPSHRFPALETTIGSAEAARRFNASESARICPACGHLNMPFPVQHWGWTEHMERAWVVESAVTDLLEAAAR